MVVRTRSPQDPKGWMSNLYLEPRVQRHRLAHMCTPVYSRLLCLHTLVVLCIVHSCNPNRGPLTYLSCTHTPLRTPKMLDPCTPTLVYPSTRSRLYPLKTLHENMSPAGCGFRELQTCLERRARYEVMKRRVCAACSK